MSSGDIVNPKRVRWIANERVDGVDVDNLSAELLEHTDASVRSLIFKPQNAGTTVPTGLILTGFNLQLNPTGGSDGNIRVLSALGVAVDADGRRIVKEAGTVVDIAIPSGTNQLYAYWNEVAVDTAARRFISVTSPFGETPNSVATKFQGTCGFWVRAGNATSIVASDNVTGQTRALVLLCVTTNTAGVISITGFDATLAPNGTFVTNRLSTVSQPTTFPQNNASGGSLRTLHDMVQTLGYIVGQLGWKNSRNTTPAALNNFQAYAVPTVRGIDALFDALSDTDVTPITVWRDGFLNRRSTIDHNGYRMGQVTEINQEWYTGLRTFVIPVGTSWTSGTSVANMSTTRTIDPGSGSGIGLFTVTTGSGSFFVNLPIFVGTTLKAVTFVAFKSSATDTFSYSVVSKAVGTLFSGTVPGTGTGTITTVLTAAVSSPNISLTQTDFFWIALASGFGNTNSTVLTATVTVIEDPQGWLFVPAIDATNLNCTTTREYNDPTVVINQRTARLITQIQASGAAPALGSLSTTLYECFLNADVAYVQEWILRTGTISDATNNRLFAAGIQNNNAGAGNRFVYFYNPNTITNWQLRIVGSSGGVDTDTGVAITANTTYRMRLEIFGANVSSAGGTNFRVRGYINGAKIVDIIVTTLPVADMIRPYFQIGTTTTANGGPYDFSIGRVRRVWNHLLNGDNL